MTLFGLIEINITLLTRKEKVRRDMQQHGNIIAVKLYRARYSCGLKEALNFIRKVESEVANETKAQ